MNEPKITDQPLLPMWGDIAVREGVDTVHHLKTDPVPFRESLAGRKPWEIRNNDRGFQEGDLVVLWETEVPGELIDFGMVVPYTGRSLTGRVQWILEGPAYGLRESWAIFGMDFDDHFPPMRHFVVCSGCEQGFDLLGQGVTRPSGMYLCEACREREQ